MGSHGARPEPGAALHRHLPEATGPRGKEEEEEAEPRTEPPSPRPRERSAAGPPPPQLRGRAGPRPSLTARPPSARPRPASSPRAAPNPSADPRRLLTSGPGMARSPLTPSRGAASCLGPGSPGSWLPPPLFTTTWRPHGTRVRRGERAPDTASPSLAAKGGAAASCQVTRAGLSSAPPEGKEEPASFPFITLWGC